MIKIRFLKNVFYAICMLFYYVLQLNCFIDHCFIVPIYLNTSNIAGTVNIFIEPINYLFDLDNDFCVLLMKVFLVSDYSHSAIS